MGRRDRRIDPGQDQRQTLGVVATSLHADRGALDGPSSAAFGPSAYGGVELRQRKIAFVGRPRIPFRGHAANALAAGRVHLVAAGAVTGSAKNFDLGHGVVSMTGARSLASGLQPVTENPSALSLSPRCCGELPAETGDFGANKGGGFRFEEALTLGTAKRIRCNMVNSCSSPPTRRVYSVDSDPNRRKLEI